MKFSRDQKGFTLLELLTSVMIFTIVIIPLSLVFMTSIRINAASKENQRMKFAATNAVEEVRSQKISNIISASQSRTVTISNEDADSAYEDNGKYVASGSTISSDLYFYGDQTASGCKYLKETVDGKTYYVEVELDPNSYKTGDDINEDTDYNSEEYAKLYKMNSSTDAYCEFPSSSAKGAVTDINLRAYLKEQNKAKDILQGMSREITLRIDKTNTGVYNVYSTATYQYMKGAVEYTYEVPEQCVFSGTTLNNLYMFYSPLYKTPIDDEGNTINYTTSGTKETISIINNANCKCNVFLVEQYDTESDANLQKNYKVNIKLAESRNKDTIFTKGSDNTYTVNIITSVRTNIRKTTDENISQVYSNASSKSVMNIQYSFDGIKYATTIKDGANKPRTAGEIMDINNLVGTQKENVVYNVIARVYTKTGWAKHIAHLNDYNAYDEDKSYKLTTTTQ